MKISYQDTRNGGFTEAKFSRDTTVFTQLEGSFCLFDASSQVPNLRASEIFCALWAAFKYKTCQVHTDTMLAGITGNLGYHWGDWSPDDERVSEWIDFYSPRVFKPSVLFALPMSAAKFNKGDVISQRMSAIEQVARLLDGHLGFDSADVISRIKIHEFLSVAERYSITVRHVSDLTPSGKAIGSWTCPCCSERRSLRHVDHQYIVTDSKGATCPKGCWGSQRVADRVSGDMNLGYLVRVTGIEMNLYTCILLHQKMGQGDRMLVRDYSNPRGTISEILARYAGRVRLSTRNYLVGQMLA